MPTIQDANTKITNFPNKFVSPWGNDAITPLYSSMPLKSPVEGCLECIVCGSYSSRYEIISSSESGVVAALTIPSTPEARVVVVGGGGSSQNASVGFNQFASGGGGGGSVNEILNLGLIAGETYTAHVGKGGMRWSNNLGLPYFSGEASYFGISGENPIIISAGGNTSGCSPCGPVNPVLPRSSGGGSGSYLGGYPPTLGTTPALGGIGTFANNGFQGWTVIAGGGGVGGGGDASSTKNSFGNASVVKAGDGGSGVYSVIAGRSFGGGGGGGAVSYSFFGTPATIVQGVGGGGGAGSGFIQPLNPSGFPIPFNCNNTPSASSPCPEQNSGSGAGGVAGDYVQQVTGADGLILLQVRADKYTGVVTGDVQITDVLFRGTLMKQIKFLGSGTYTA
jgi:hypothetical protein